MDSQRFEPRFQKLLAMAICVLAALTLLWPLLTGQILLGGTQSDMFIAGYSFRLFAAETFKATGSIPQWNPYIFGGLPYIAAMHGDIFYPTAWLRWIMPVDLAITWGMAIHVVLAGWLTYGFARALKLSWGAAITAGVAYELTGIVASQISPGHDGKLFVSALTPLAFWVLLHAIRGAHDWAYGAFAFVVALLVLGHYNMCYFLLVALGLWALYLAFWDPDRPSGLKPWRSLSLAILAVVVGVGIAGLQVMPFLEYVKYSPRATGGPNTGWEFATSYAMPPSEIFTTILPQFNGVLDRYWGQNPIKFHTEYLGFVPLALAVLAWGDKARRRLVVAISIGALLFLLFAFAGHTPFYRPFFELLPFLSKIRAIGMVFFLVAFLVSILAGIGMDRLLSRTVSARSVLIVVTGFALFALLGAVGALQGIAEGLATPERMTDVLANETDLRLGALRLLLFVGVGGGSMWGAASGRLKPPMSIAVVLVFLAGDLWSVDRLFYHFSPRAEKVFTNDAVTSYLQKIKMPYRVLDAGLSYGHSSILMAYRIPSALGYHGFEMKCYDELIGANAKYANLLSANLIDLLSIRFLILGTRQTVPGFHQVVGPTSTMFGATAVLYERDTIPSYVRVVPSAAKIPESQVVSTVVDSGFPFNAVTLFPDSSSVRGDSLTQPLPTSGVRAEVTAWEPGRMSVSLKGADTRTNHLLISENWYPDWHATVDGRSAIVRRGDHALSSVDIPIGAREVQLWFRSPAYDLGKKISLLAVCIAAVMILGPLALEKRLRLRFASRERPA